MGEHATEDELVALEHEWAQAVLENESQSPHTRVSSVGVQSHNAKDQEC